MSWPATAPRRVRFAVPPMFTTVTLMVMFTPGAFDAYGAVDGAAWARPLRPTMARARAHTMTAAVVLRILAVEVLMMSPFRGSRCACSDGVIAMRCGGGVSNDRS